MRSFVVGGGCFWCIDAVFRQFKGVSASVCGYAGGTVPNPDYRSVCSGTTGHHEVVRVDFDENVIGEDAALDMFFSRPHKLGSSGCGYRFAVPFGAAVCRRAAAEGF